MTKKPEKTSGLASWTEAIERHAKAAEEAQKRALDTMQQAMPEIKDSVRFLDNEELVDYLIRLQFEGRTVFDPCHTLWDELREFVSAEVLRRLNGANEPKTGE